MTDSDWLYVALCLLVPLWWGILTARLFDWWQARRSRRLPKRPADSDSADMYHI